MVLAALLTTAVWGAYRLHTGIVLEDALITFRHAENLASGNGYGFNAGEWLQGSTTPLLTLCLAAISAVLGRGAIDEAAAVIGICSGAATSALTVDLLRRWGVSPSMIALSVGGWVLTPGVVWSGVGGMETPMVAAFMALSLWSVEIGSGLLCASALSALLLTRLDTLPWVMILAAVAARLGLWRTGWPALVVVLLWLLFAVWAFGNPIPHSILAKAIVNPHEGPLMTGPMLLARARWFSDSLGAPLPALPAAGVALTVFGWALVWRTEHAMWRIPALFLPIFAAVMHLLRAPGFLWYPVPAAWAASLLGACAVQRMFVLLPKQAMPLMGIPVSILLAASLVHLEPSMQEAREIQENETQMRALVGRWLSENVPPGRSVLMEAIGYQGTFSNRRVVDLAGLVSPQVLAIAREEPNNARRFAKILEKEHPYAIVLRSWEVPQNLHFHGDTLFDNTAAKRAFLERYKEAAQLRAPHPEHMGQNHTVAIYTERGQPRPESARHKGVD